MRYFWIGIILSITTPLSSQTFFSKNIGSLTEKKSVVTFDPVILESLQAVNGWAKQYIKEKIEKIDSRTYYPRLLALSNKVSDTIKSAKELERVISDAILTSKELNPYILSPVEQPTGPKKFNAATQRVVDSINAGIRALMQQPLYDKADKQQSLRDILRETSAFLDTIPSVKKFRDEIKDALAFDKIDEFLPDTIALSPRKLNPEESICPELHKSILKFDLLGNNSYTGIITDISGNALASFLIKEPNQESFYDKLSTAMQKICPDENTVKNLVDALGNKKNDLYKEFLEKSSEQQFDAIGILKVNRRIYVDTSDSKVSKSARKDAEEVEKIKKADEEKKRKQDEKSTGGDSDGDLSFNVERSIRSNFNTGNNFSEVSSRRSIKDWRNHIAQFEYLEHLSMLFKSKTHVYSSNLYKNSTKYWGKGDPKFKLNSPPNFTLQDIQIQFQDGFIENIRVIGKFDGSNHVFQFENVGPIPFSVKRNYADFADTKLYEKSNQIAYGDCFLTLSDVINYLPNYEVYSKNYCPMNQVVKMNVLTQPIHEVALYKEQSAKVLELKVFSDLRGVDNDNPNGLIQFALSKKLNFWSKRYRFFGNWANYGWINYITPRFEMNKIEENQKRLVSNTIYNREMPTDALRPISYTSTINLLKHQIFNVGFDLSVFLLDIPALKSTFDIGTTLQFGRVAMQDTLRVKELNNPPPGYNFIAAKTNNIADFAVNTFQAGPYITWQIFPDSRFGVSASQRFNWFKGLTSRFVQVRDSLHYLNFVQSTPDLLNNPYKIKKILGSSEIFAFFGLDDPDNDTGGKKFFNGNKLFFRYRLNWEMDNSKENYHQLQIGFSTYIKATKEYDRLSKKILGNNP